MYTSAFPYTLQIQGELLRFDAPKIMGILNVTPDSFYEKSRCLSLDAVVARTAEIIEQGACMVDVGACSTRPGSNDISQEEEMRRLLPALEAIREKYPDILLSVDTYRAAVAEKAIREYHVGMVNDISAGTLDPKMFETVARCQVPYVLTHIQGNPTNMQQQTRYENVANDICRFFSEKMAQLKDLGLNDVMIDPGFGFGKNQTQNYELLRRLPDFSILQAPILVGVSRKSMIYKLLETTPEGSLNGTTAVHMLALMGGAQMLRVHDVKAAVECVKIYQSYKTSQSC